MHRRRDSRRKSDRAEEARQEVEEWTPVGLAAAAGLLREFLDDVSRRLASSLMDKEAVAMHRLSEIEVHFLDGKQYGLSSSIGAELGKVKASLRLAWEEKLSGGVSFEVMAKHSERNRFKGLTAPGDIQDKPP